MILCLKNLLLSTQVQWRRQGTAQGQVLVEQLLVSLDAIGGCLSYLPKQGKI